MATIRLTDSSGVELAPVLIGLASTFAKYFKGNVLNVVAATKAVPFLRQRLDAPAAKSLSVDLAFDRDFTLGSTGAVLTTKIGTQLSVDLLTTDDETLVDDEWFQAVEVPAGQTYVVLSFAPSATVEAAGGTGPLGLGFAASGSITTKYAEPFGANAEGPTVAQAVATLLSRHRLPGDLDDLSSLQVGALASVAGEGSLTVSATFDLATVANPLATASLPAGLGSAELVAGGSVVVGFEARIAGAYELRLFKRAEGVVRLGYFRRKEAAWSIDLSAKIGADVSIRGREVIAALLGAVVGKPKVDVNGFLDAGLTPDDIDAIKNALEASVNRTLTVALEASFSSLKRTDAAFEYELALDLLNDESRRAVEAALDGDLRALHQADLPGVKIIRSLHVTLRQKTTVLKVNLFGIVNAISLREFIRESRVAFDAESGELVLADTVSSRRLGLVSRASRVESDRLRKVLLESFIATAAYRAGHLDGNVDVDISQQHFEFHRKTDRQTMTDNLEAIAGVGLLSGEALKERIRLGPADFGPSTFLLETSLGRKATPALFLDAQGRARSVDDYDRIGLRALLSLIPEGSPQSFRRILALRHDLWPAVRQGGSEQNVAKALRPAFGNQPPAALGVVFSDVVRITWWSDAMHAAAKALATMRGFLAGRDPGALQEDPTFRQHREALEKALGKMVKESISQFGDPWGVIAVDLAAGQAGPARAIVASPALSLSVARPV